MKKTNVVILHAHRKLPGDPEKELNALLWRIAKEVYADNILEMAEDYNEAKAGEVYLQVVNKGRIDRDELYDSMIAWATEKLSPLQETVG